MAEGRDWFEVVAAATCPDCGFDATALGPEAIAPAVATHAAAFAALVRATTPSVLRARPAPDTWSALEYAAHVRDVLAVFDARILRALAETDPELGWWDHEAAVVDEAYVAQDPRAVADALAANADAFAARLAAVPADGWARTATRRGVEHFRVDGLARFVLHEVQHHLHDARAAVGAAS